MSDSPLPKTGREAVVQLLWGTIIFATGFEGVVKTVEGEILIGLCCFVAALLLTLGLVYRAQIANFIGRNMTSIFIGLAVFGALLLGLACGALFFRGTSLLGAPNTGRISWNFDDPVRRTSEYILVMAASGPKSNSP